MNNLKDNLNQIKVSDTVKVIDTVKAFKLVPTIPIKKISSEDGAIIPKQALQMAKLEPAKPIEKEENSNYVFLFLLGIGVLAILLFLRFFNNKVKKRKEQI